MIGLTIAHYKITEKIGEGGMGVVFKALDTKLKRTVALKFLPPELVRDTEATERFIHEAQAASSFEHPNICTIHGIDETESGQLYIIMACYDGMSLKQRINQGPMEIKESIDVSIQIAQGLARAHERGIVHRDIKPANIMLTKEGIVKIVDFGLAFLTGQSRLTREGTTMGTIAYMSPEQTRGGEVDHRTDIWSLGVVLYEMINGQRPFKGHYDQAVMYSILNEQPDPISHQIEDIPREFDSIIQKALAKKVEERYQHMTDMLKSLQAHGKETEPEILPQDTDKTMSIPSIAVLPFDNLSADKEQEYFCDGTAEEIINALARVENLRVVARTSAFAFKGHKGDVREIGRQLAVDSLLEGSVRKAGQKIRIIAQLVNVKDGYHIWSEKFDRDLEDIFSIQDEIALAIADKLKGKLLKREKLKVVKHSTDNLEAYTLYLKGRYFWNRRYEGELQKALEYFNRAIEKDPHYALAYTGIADSYNLIGLFGLLPPREAYAKAKHAAEKALEIDNTLAEAHVSMGWIKTFFDWDWSSAETQFKRALELNANYATAHEWYGILLSALGRFEEGIASAKRAQSLDPLSLTINTMVAWNIGLARRYDEAIDILLRTVELDPRFPLTYFFLGVAYSMKGMGKEAIEAHRKLLKITAGTPYAIGFLGMSYAMAGRNAAALNMLERLDALSEKRYISPFYKAIIFMGLDELDRAFDLLKEAYEVKESYMALLNSLPIFDTLREDPRFGELVHKMGL